MCGNTWKHKSAWHRGCYWGSTTWEGGACIRIIHTAVVNKSPNFSGLTVCRLSSYSRKEPVRVFLTGSAFLLCPWSDSRIQAPSILWVCHPFYCIQLAKEKRGSEEKTHLLLQTSWLRNDPSHFRGQPTGKN